MKIKNDTSRGGTVNPGEISAAAGRDPSVDVVRGIAILAVIYAHTAPFCREFLHFFALTVFLVTSGYCCKNRVRSHADWRHYMAGKLRTLYLPCAAYNGVYALLWGVFLRIGFYTDDPAFLTMTADWPVQQKLYPLHGIGEILRKFFRVILMTDTTQMGTATWFLIMLFMISAFHGAVSCLTAGLELRRKRAVLGGLFVLMALLAQFAKLPFDAWVYPRCFFYSYLTYLVGIGVRDLDLRFLEKPVCGWVSFVLLAVLSRWYLIDLANVKIDGVLPYLAGVLGGWCMLKTPANRIATRRGRQCRIFRYLGRHTIPIIGLHVLCFKPVTWLYIRSRDLPQIYLASFHTDFDASETWKLLYLAAGAVLPLLLAAVWRRLLKKASSVHKLR